MGPGKLTKIYSSIRCGSSYLLGGLWVLALTMGPALAAPISRDGAKNDFSLPTTIKSPWGSTVKRVLERLYPSSKTYCAQEEIGNERILFFNEENLIFQKDNISHDEPIEITIHTDTELKAYALPMKGEKHHSQVVLSYGLLNLVDNESELAFVLAHEITHIARDHFSAELPFAMFSSAQLAHIALTHQNWELVADREAIQTLSKSGFNAAASIDILERISRITGGSSQPILSRHPALNERINTLRALVRNH